MENPDGLRAGEQSVAVLSCMDGIGGAGSLLFSSAVLQKGTLISVQLWTQGLKPLHLSVACASPRLPWHHGGCPRWAKTVHLWLYNIDLNLLGCLSAASSVISSARRVQRVMSKLFSSA